MRRIMTAVGVCVLGLATLPAQEKPIDPPKPTAEPLTKLIERLASREYRAREAAGRAIEARGVTALPELRTALAAADNAEVRKRLHGMVQNLERIQTLSPKRVTIKMKDRPVAEIVREVARQTGYAMQYQGGQQGAILTVEMVDATYWEVMDRVCNLAGLTMYHNEGQGMVLYQQEGFWPHVCHRGPFKVVANNFNYNKTMNFGPINRNPGSNQLRSEALAFAFTLHAEPKLPLMSVGQVRLLEAIDELGVSMVPPAVQHEVNYNSHNGYRTYQYGSSLNLKWPNKEARSVKQLRGVIPVTLLGEQKPEIVIEDILKVKNKKFTGANVEVQIDDVKEQNNKTTFHIKMSVRNIAPNASHDYSWTNSVHQRIEVLDAKGNKLPSQGYNWENSSPGHVQATFMFGTNGNATLGPPAKLVYNHWAMMHHQIEFEFKDLQLP